MQTLLHHHIFSTNVFLTLINIDDNFLFTFVLPISHARLRLLVAEDSGASSCSLACTY